MKIFFPILFICILNTQSCVAPKPALTKFSQEMVPIELRHIQLNEWWNIYVARERVPHYEIPAHIFRIGLYKKQLQELNAKLTQIQAPDELAHVKQIFLDVYAKRLTYSTLAEKYYRIGDEQGLEEVDKGIDEANELHGKAIKEWDRILKKYGLSLQEIVENELKKRKDR